MYIYLFCYIYIYMHLYMLIIRLGVAAFGAWGLPWNMNVLCTGSLFMLAIIQCVLLKTVRFTKKVSFSKSRCLHD